MPTVIHLRTFLSLKHIRRSDEGIGVDHGCPRIIKKKTERLLPRPRERGTFAGASADGRRFAIDSSYTEGDPDFVVYEYFTVYDAETGKALAMVHTKDFPARQSWSAFSSNGRYFAAGNPNKLTMYELP